MGAVRMALALVLAAAAVAWPGAAAAAAAAAAGTRTAQPADPRVLLIGDSISTGMLWYPQAVSIVQKNLAFTWQVAVCRTLTGESCPFLGARSETALELIASLPSVPPWVVVEMGYNDPLDTFSSAVDQTISALLAKGAKHVLWLTLRAAREPYPELDQILTAAAATHPQLELVDWNDYAASQPGWFQNDGVHLTYLGGIAMAHLVHGSLYELIAPLRVHLSILPSLYPRHRYRAKLRATGGTPPYSWAVGSGEPPRGLRLLANGVVTGTPVGTGPLDFVARVTDADGVHVSARVRARRASS